MSDEELMRQMGEIGFVRRIISVFGVVSLIQLFGAIWWASSMTTTLEYVKKEISSLKQDLNISLESTYRSSDAMKDFKQIEERINRIQIQVNKNEDKLEILYNKFPAINKIR